MKSVLKSIILENQHTPIPEVKERALQIPIHQNIIISLIGARRSGKTYMLYELMQKLLDEQVTKEQLLFINFEDERLQLHSDQLDLIIQAYQELYPGIALKEVYIFFDEIQNITGWEKFIRRIFDTKTRNIFITGSNSKLLSTEIATELRGRTISYTVYPLNFKEYLNFHNTQPLLHPQSNKSKIIHLAEKYLKAGAFPEVINMEKLAQKKLLQQYFNVMIFRDIVERYQITNVEILKFFIKKIFAGVTKPFSVNKAYRDLKSLGYSISNKYLYDYFDYCSAVFLTQNIYKFNFSEIKQLKSDKKNYVIDSGLLSAIEFSVSENAGKLLENTVALEFIKNETPITYFKNQYECDFIVQKNNTFQAVQVSYTIASSETKNREMRGLHEACDHLKIDSGVILTFDDPQEHTRYKGIHIHILPFYQYFLMNY